MRGERGREEARRSQVQGGPEGLSLEASEGATFSERKACIGCGGTRLRELSGGAFDESPLREFIEEDPWGENPAPFLRGRRWSYVACEDCGLAFHRFILSPEWNERKFTKWLSQEAIADFENSRRTPEKAFRKAASYASHILRIERLTRGLRGGAAPRLLDFGCGYGEFLSMCALYGFEAFGVDRSPARRENGGFLRVFAEIEEVAPFAPFHALTLFEVLEHLDAPAELLTRLRDLLAPGGLLVLETPDCSGVLGIATASDYRKIDPLDHINCFTPESLRGFAERLGFRAIAKPLCCVAGGAVPIAKALAKGILSPLMRPTTQLYFRKF